MFKRVTPLVVLLALSMLLNTTATSITIAQSAYEPGEEIGFRLLQGAVGGIAWSPDGSYIAVSLSGYSRVAVFPADDLESVKSISVPFNPGPLEWRPDSEYIAVGTSSRLVITDLDGNRILDRDVGARINDLAWTLDGDKLAAVLDNGDLVVWDSDAGLTPPIPTLSAALTAVDWMPGDRFIILGDSSGRVKVLDFYSYDYTFQATLFPTPVRSIEVSPDGRLVAMAGDNVTILASIDNSTGNLTVYATLDWGTRGSLSWSPDGSTLVIPAGMRLVVVNRTGEVQGLYTPTREYPYTYASWSPTDYYKLALAGYNIVFGYSGLYITYSGALVHVRSSHPVAQVCAGAHCGQVIEYNPSNLNASFMVSVLASTVTGDSAAVEAFVYFTVKPFTVYDINAAEALLGGEYKVYIPTGLSLLFIFTSPEASITLASSDVNASVNGPVVAATPGEYQLTIRLPEPEDYLGPAWVLVRTASVYLPPSGAVWLDYSSFSLANVTARLVVDAEPGSTISLVMSNETVEAVLPGRHAEYTVPVGDYTVRLELPVNSSILVPDDAVLERSRPVRVHPGDVVTMSFTYMDVLGGLEVIAPEGSRITVELPWPSVPITVELPEGYITYLAYPGNYTITLRLAKPGNFLGPDPPSMTVVASVERGENTIVNFYNEKQVSEYLNLIASSATVTVSGVEGYELLITSNNETVFQATDPGPHTLLLPPGNYTVVLVRPADNAVLDEEHIQVTGPGDYTIELSLPQQQTLPPPVQPTTEQGRGLDKAKIALAVMAPIIVAAAAIIVIRRRARPAF